MKWLFPPVRIAVPSRLAKIFLSNPGQAFAFDDLVNSARIGHYRLSWILNQMTRVGVLVTDIVPGTYPNIVKYRMREDVAAALGKDPRSLNDSDVEEFVAGLSGR
jgi:hypothetical protein